MENKLKKIKNINNHLVKDIQHIKTELEEVDIIKKRQKEI